MSNAWVASWTVFLSITHRVHHPQYYVTDHTYSQKQQHSNDALFNDDHPCYVEVKYIFATAIINISLFLHSHSVSMSCVCQMYI